MGPLRPIDWNFAVISFLPAHVAGFFMSSKKITIIEFAPCVDVLLGITQGAEEGYAGVDRGLVAIRSGSRLRPTLLSINAGGKASNVARVIDKLITDRDSVEVELIVFRADSPEGRYLAELQSAELSRVRLRSVMVDSTSRFCINVSDTDSRQPSRVEFNLSPRVIWQPNAIGAVLGMATEMATDLLLVAGNPPVIAPHCRMAVDLPAAIIKNVPNKPAISIDIEKGALADCIDADPQPDVIKINREEFASVHQQHWGRYQGILIVTDDEGCTVWGSGTGGPPTRVDRARGQEVHSTVGAGDATHAGFSIAHWVWGFDPVRAARYGMAVAASLVSSPAGARGVRKKDVDRFFSQLEAAAQRTQT